MTSVLVKNALEPAGHGNITWLMPSKLPGAPHPRWMPDSASPRSRQRLSSLKQRVYVRCGYARFGAIVSTCNLHQDAEFNSRGMVVRKKRVEICGANSHRYFVQPGTAVACE